VLEKFVNPINKGLTYVDSHTASQIAEVIINQFPDTSIESLTTAIQSYKDIDAWRTDISLTETEFDRLQDIMIDAGEAVHVQRQSLLYLERKSILSNY